MTHLPSRRWLVPVALLILSAVLAGCTSGRAGLTGASWPGILTSDDTIYVAFASQVYALDRDSGKQLWVFDAPTGARGLFSAQRPAAFYAPPALGESVLVIGDYNGGLYGLNPEDGDRLWVFRAVTETRILGLFRSSQPGRFIGGALVEGDTVYVGAAADGHVYALDAESGEEKWRFRAEQDIWSTPLLADGTLYVTSLDHRLYALDPETGDELWHYKAGGAIVSTPTIHDGVLYFAAFDNQVYALNTQTQKVVWTHPTENWVFSSPAFTDDRLIVADLKGNVYCLMAESGEECWQFPTETEEPVVGPPIIVGDTVYFTSGDQNIYALDLESGEESAKVTLENEFTSRFPLIGETGTREREVPLYAPPVPLDDLILIGFHQGNDILRAYDPETWQAEWSFRPGE